MAVDEHQANRIRTVLGDLDHSVREQRMFGGIAWMVRGNMAVGTGDDGGVLVRVGKPAMDDMLAMPHVGPMQMGERTMGGFVVVDAAGVDDDGDLRTWVLRGVDHALSLPPK